MLSGALDFVEIQAISKQCFQIIAVNCKPYLYSLLNIKYKQA